MKYIHFVWDDNKGRLNQSKHKISFDEAKTVFFDPNAKVMHDPDHSIDEERYVILGMSNNMRLLVVTHCYTLNDEEIRIISARKAEKHELVYYGGE
jgi:uncharacterized DUF497 family protein